MLCDSKNRAIAILQTIGKLLRNLGLNQNERKTRPLTPQESIKDVFNEPLEKTSEIIKKSQKPNANKNLLLKELREVFKTISRKQKLDSNDEAALFRIYYAARIFDSPMLRYKTCLYFEKFPIRAKSICGYARRFINYKPIFRAFSKYLKRNKRFLLYNFQLAFLVTVFRNLRKRSENIFKAILSIALDKRWHWYVRVQAINTLSYLGVNSIKKANVHELLSIQNHHKIRRAAVTLIPLCCNKEEAIAWLQKMASELDITVSRMANYSLSLSQEKDVAMQQLKKFSNLNYVFLGDQIWSLWLISLNNNPDIKRNFNLLIRKIGKDYYNYPIIKEHVLKIK